MNRPRIPDGRPFEPDPDRQWDERGEREIARQETPVYEDPTPDAGWNPGAGRAWRGDE